MENLESKIQEIIASEKCHDIINLPNKSALPDLVKVTGNEVVHNAADGVIIRDILEVFNKRIITLWVFSTDGTEF